MSWRFCFKTSVQKDVPTAVGVGGGGQMLTEPYEESFVGRRIDDMTGIPPRCACPCLGYKNTSNIPVLVDFPTGGPA